MKKNSSGQKIAIFAFIGILVFFGVFIGITMTQGGGTSDTKDGNNQNSYDQAMEMAEAEKKLENMLSDVKRQKETPQKASVTDDEMLSEKDELPEISKYPLSVTGKGGINVEIFSSPLLSFSATLNVTNSTVLSFLTVDLASASAVKFPRMIIFAIFS